MSEIVIPLAADPASTAEEASDKIRGRIPKNAWGYVRGQYEIAKRTYEQIGEEFNCTPSAVFYVVKQAALRGIPATLEAPSADALPVRSQRVATPRSVRPSMPTEPSKPSQVELMAQQANAMLEDETCKRLFDSTSKVIVDYVAFKAGPEESAKKLAKESLHELRRAIAAIELKIEMTQLLAPQVTTAPAPTSTEPAEG